MNSFLVPKYDLTGKSFHLSVPSSKSLANRMLILSALTKGSFSLQGDFAAEDIQLMITALREMGVIISESENGLYVENDMSWRKNHSDLELFLGNSGTCIRFLTVLNALRAGKTLLTGKERMKERPLSDLIKPLQQLGIDLRSVEEDGYPPLLLEGTGLVEGGVVSIHGDVSSQYLTALLLSSCAFEKGLEIHIEGPLISRPYVDMTIALLKYVGISVLFDELKRTIKVEPKILTPRDLEVEGDASAATYWWALAMLQNCEIMIDNIPNNSVQGDVQFVQIVKSISNDRRHIDMNDLPDASLTLMAMAPLLLSETYITNIGSLRVKETDRLTAMATELRKLGVIVEVGSDWIRIQPLDFSSYNSSRIIQIETYDDHRVAMSMAILGTRLGNLEILDPDCVNKTYPNFWRDLMSFDGV